MQELLKAFPCVEVTLLKSTVIQAKLVGEITNSLLYFLFFNNKYFLNSYKRVNLNYGTAIRGCSDSIHMCVPML